MDRAVAVGRPRGAGAARGRAGRSRHIDRGVLADTISEALDESGGGPTLPSDPEDAKGDTPLTRAARRGCTGAINILLRAGASITAPTAARSLASGRWIIAPGQSVAIVRSACTVFASESSLVRRMRTSAEVTRRGAAGASTAWLNSSADWHHPRSAQEKLGFPFHTVATPTRAWLRTCDAAAIVTAERARTGRALLAVAGDSDARLR